MCSHYVPSSCPRSFRLMSRSCRGPLALIRESSLCGSPRPPRNCSELRSSCSNSRRPSACGSRRWRTRHGAHCRPSRYGNSPEHHLLLSRWGNHNIGRLRYPSRPRRIRRVRPSSLRDHGRRLCLRPGPVRRRHETGPPHPRCRWHPRKTAASYSGWCCCPPFGATASCRARCTSPATRAPFASAAWTLGGSRLAGCGRTLASLGSEASSRPRSTPSCSS
mmetsp:Transcript_62373/g.150360  ORF Transcript_62373/g.150360 Transcript_62373/m.150360 type:complete len:220 (-) Transcript_62373:181-840(-)